MFDIPKENERVRNYKKFSNRYGKPTRVSMHGLNNMITISRLTERYNM